MPGIGIITNPHSKLNKRAPDRQRILGYIVGDHGKLELTNTLDDLARAAESFCARNISVLAINGGDGTISRTLTAFIKAYGSKPLPQVLILKGGTINVLAENLGLNGSPEQILVRYIESMSQIRVSEVVNLRTLEVGGHYGFLFGNGLVANYLEKFYLNKTGPLGAVWLVFKIYFWWVFNRARYFDLIQDGRFDLTLEQGSVRLPESRSCTIMASTVGKMPLGHRMFKLIPKSLEQFQFFSLEIPALALPWRLPFALLHSRNGRRFGRLNHLASHLNVTTTDERPQKYTLDGELFDAHDGKLSISLGPKIEFLVV